RARSGPELADPPEHRAPDHLRALPERLQSDVARAEAEHAREVDAEDLVVGAAELCLRELPARGCDPLVVRAGRIGEQPLLLHAAPGACGGGVVPDVRGPAALVAAVARASGARRLRRLRQLL